MTVHDSAQFLHSANKIAKCTHESTFSKYKCCTTKHAKSKAPAIALLTLRSPVLASPPSSSAVQQTDSNANWSATQFTTYVTCLLAAVKHISEHIKQELCVSAIMVTSHEHAWRMCLTIDDHIVWIRCLSCHCRAQLCSIILPGLDIACKVPKQLQGL